MPIVSNMVDFGYLKGELLVRRKSLATGNFADVMVADWFFHYTYWFYEQLLARK